MALIKMNFLSQVLGMQTNITVALPSFSFADIVQGAQSYYVPGMKFQVLYLLHGGSGDDSDWVNFSSVLRYADDNKLAIIMAPAFNSSYVDMVHGGRYFTFFTEELPQVCQAFFPISDKREDTFIAGLSMGGNGAMRLALKRPDLYSQALCMSGAAFDVQELKRRAAQPPFNTAGRIAMPDMEDTYGDLNAFEGSGEDMFFVAKRNLAQGKPMPKFYFACGGDDFALTTVRKAHEHLKSLGYDTQLEEIPGYGHEWDFWDLYIRKAIGELFPLIRKPILPN